MCESAEWGMGGRREAGVSVHDEEQGPREREKVGGVGGGLGGGWVREGKGVMAEA